MKTLLTCIIAPLLLLMACAGTVTRPESAGEELERAKQLLENDRGEFLRLNRTSYPGKGYFYIISPAGIILSHPETALEGVDYSSYDFVMKILREKNGCISLNTSGRTINIFYRELINGDILCFTFESSPDIKTYKECTRGSSY